MKKKLILLVILIIILIIVVVGSVIIINDLEKNKLNEQNNEEELLPPDVQNKVVEEFVKVLENGVKKNISNKIKETKTFDGLEITNVDFYYSNGQTIFKADLTNKTNQDFKEKIVKLVLLDEQQNEIAKIPTVLNNVKASQKITIESSTTLDFSNAYDYKIEF